MNFKSSLFLTFGVFQICLISMLTSCKKSETSSTNQNKEVNQARTRNQRCQFSKNLNADTLLRRNMRLKLREIRGKHSSQSDAYIEWMNSSLSGIESSSERDHILTVGLTLLPPLQIKNKVDLIYLFASTEGKKCTLLNNSFRMLGDEKYELNLDDVFQVLDELEYNKTREYAISGLIQGISAEKINLVHFIKQ